MDDVKKLEEAKRLYKDANADQRYVLERLFPELRKYSRKPAEWNAEDEQNLNACLSFLPDEFLARWLKDVIHREYDEPVWSEQKAEPKFHECDWVVNNNGEPQLYQVTVCSWPDSKIKRVKDNLESFINTATLDKQYHLWTIKDAKPGDVLTTNSGRTFIFKGCLDKSYPNGPVAYCGIDSMGDFRVGMGINRWTDENVYPATEEQRSLLFKKMRETEYEWNAEKKELKNIDQKQVINYPDNLPKDNWELIHEFVNKFGRIPKDEDELNVLIEYVLKRQRPTWSEEDERLIKESSEYLRKYANKVQGGNSKVYIQSLSDRVESLYCPLAQLKSGGSQVMKRWKPSKKQMEALSKALSLARYYGEECEFDLKTLQGDLKKLKEE